VRASCRIEPFATFSATTNRGSVCTLFAVESICASRADLRREPEIHKGALIAALIPTNAALAAPAGEYRADIINILKVD